MELDWANFSDTPATPIATRTPLSPGFHFGQIEKATIEKGWRISDDNPSGDCLSLWVDCVEDDEQKRVFVTIPKNEIWRIVLVAKSCNVPPPVRGETEWDEAQLVGRRCYVETTTYTVRNGNNAGQIRASVSQWVAFADQPTATETTQERRARKDPSEETPARAKRTAKPDWQRKETATDDIPF
jgi:hypothetical protein